MSGTGDVCIYEVKSGFHICGMRHCGINVFRTPFSPIFLGKACLDTRIAHVQSQSYVYMFSIFVGFAWIWKLVLSMA